MPICMNILINIISTDNDKLIFLASSNLSPAAYVLLYLSDPARSTKFSFPALIFYFPVPSYISMNYNNNINIITYAS